MFYVVYGVTYMSNYFNFHAKLNRSNLVKNEEKKNVKRNLVLFFLLNCVKLVLKNLNVSKGLNFT